VSAAREEPVLDVGSASEMRVSGSQKSVKASVGAEIGSVDVVRMAKQTSKDKIKRNGLKLVKR
jgi:hypothetical protein